MTDSISSAVVIGGGILGVSAAAALARRGVTTTLVTEGALASGASGRSLAWLNSAGARSRAYHDLRMAGIARYRTWAAERPGSSAYLRFRGGLTWAGPGETFRPRFEHERALGYEARWLSPAEAAAAVPGVAADAIAEEGAIFNPGEAWVELPLLIRELADELTAAGGTIVTDAGHTTPVVEGGRAVGAVAADGRRWPADAVLLATGPAVPGQLADLGVSVPDASPAAMVMFTKPAGTALTSVLNTPRVAIRPTADGGLAMDSAWSEEALTVEDGRIRVPDSAVAGLIEEARRVLAGAPDLEVDHLGTGFKPVPGDGEPVLGAVDDIDGLFVAFTHSGATLGLVAGELLADAMAGLAPSALMAPFSPSRFR